MPPVPSEEHERPEPTQTQLLKDRRFKLSRACDRCRRRRIKCDEGHPCQACLTAKSACTFEEVNKKSHAQRSKRTSTLEERMNQLEMLVQTIPANIFASRTAEPNILDGMDITGSTSTLPAPTVPAGGLHSIMTAGVPPPSLSQHKLINPSNHFVSSFQPTVPQSPIEILSSRMGSMSIATSFLYHDDEGCTRWQGATSGLPLLEMLVERCRPSAPVISLAPSNDAGEHAKWFPDRQTQPRVEVNPEMLWRSVTGVIPADLMDLLVQQYLSTTYYMVPFLHIPTFLHDYSNPTKWGEPGFACFIVAVCCLASRQVDDPRVLSDPADSFSCGSHWFDFFTRLRTLSTGERPTLYTIQAVLLAAVYAVGMGRLSKGFALLAEAVTLSFDAGLHRSVEAYETFDPIEKEVRSRIFWSVYWVDKQFCSAFGRPPTIRLRDCDVPEANPIDDEYITEAGISPPPPNVDCRMATFCATVRYYIVMESVMDVPSTTPPPPASFLARCAASLGVSHPDPQLVEAEAMLDEITNSVPFYWQYPPPSAQETMGMQEDVIQVTQSHRLRGLDQVVRMYIYRHRLETLLKSSESSGIPNDEAELQVMMACHQACTGVIQSQLEVATRGLMGFFDVGTIHQLNQAGRTLVAVLLNCRSVASQELLVGPCIEALKSCVVLLRRFSIRYMCGLRSADLIEEACRVAGVPLSLPPLTTMDTKRRAWIRPLKKKSGYPGDGSGSGSSPLDHHSTSETSPGGDTHSVLPNPYAFGTFAAPPPPAPPEDILALLNTAAFDTTISLDSVFQPAQGGESVDASSNNNNAGSLFGTGERSSAGLDSAGGSGRDLSVGV